MLRPVLVVDDDDAIGRLIAATLKEHGLAVVTIYDGSRDSIRPSARRSAHLRPPVPAS
jgi:DNA-binding response OmpR family regulator